MSGGVVPADWSPGGGPGSPGGWPPPLPHPPSTQDTREKRPSPAGLGSVLDYPDTSQDYGAPATKRARHAHHRHAHQPSYQLHPGCSSSHRVPSPPGAGDLGDQEEEEEEGCNSEDEYSHVGQNLTEEEWREKDVRFERLMRRKGYSIKKMGEDGACLFRAVADQLYGDEEMHQGVRTQCMDYIVSTHFFISLPVITSFIGCRFQEGNADYFSQYVTENFTEYVRRKRRSHVHGNHLEIQALAEMYCRPIHIYCYSSGQETPRHPDPSLMILFAEPINIFQHIPQSESEVSIPMRLCYHRGVHYNSLVDPNNASLGVGLGLPGLKPGINDKNTVR